MLPPTRAGLLDLLRRRIVVAPMAGGPSTTGLPQIAAGGIMGPRQVRAVLAAGAAAAQCGTAFLRSPESGAHPLHKAALADPRSTATVVTRAFSGRPGPRAGQPVHRRARGRAARRSDVVVGGTGLPSGDRTACRRDRRVAARMIPCAGTGIRDGAAKLRGLERTEAGG